MPLPQSGSATCIRPKTAALPLASKSLHAQSKIRAARGISSKTDLSCSFATGDSHLVKRLFNRLLPKSWRSSVVTIPVIRLHGTIMAGGGQFRPSLSLASTAALIEKAFLFDAPAVAISINSPGGSPVQSRLIFKRIRDLAIEKNKKVLVFVEDVAASGGYMIAVAGDESFADPSSIVGSIGVVSASFGFPELMKKIGIERRVHTAGQNKAVLDPFKPEKKEDVERLKALQLEVHDTFIDLVKERRGSKLKDDPDLFTGLFWTGKKGLELGLVDALNDMRTVLKTRFGAKTQLRLITAPRGLFGRIGLFGSNFSAPDIAAAAASGVIDAAEERALWARFGL
jgi:signal peptide peptidase SppA